MVDAQDLKSWASSDRACRFKSGPGHHFLLISITSNFKINDWHKNPGLIANSSSTSMQKIIDSVEFFICKKRRHLVLILYMAYISSISK